MTRGDPGQAEAHVVASGAQVLHRAGLEVGTAAVSPARNAAAAIEVLVARLDMQGRVRFGKVATAMGWVAPRELSLAMDKGVMRLSEAAGALDDSLGIAVQLDSRRRVQLPFGIRAALAVRPGARLMLLAAPGQGVVVVPVIDLVDRLTTSP